MNLCVAGVRRGAARRRGARFADPRTHARGWSTGSGCTFFDVASSSRRHISTAVRRHHAPPPHRTACTMHACALPIRPRLPIAFSFQPGPSASVAGEGEGAIDFSRELQSERRTIHFKHTQNGSSGLAPKTLFLKHASF